jgi:hypothetical protein
MIDWTFDCFYYFVKMRPREPRGYQRVVPEQEAAKGGTLVRVFFGLIALGFMIGAFAYSVKTYHDTEALLTQQELELAGKVPCQDCPYYLDVQLQSDLEHTMTSIFEAASNKDPISWSTYVNDTASNAGCPVMLMNADFAGGTLRITSGGLFFLGEDVEFNPNPDNDFKPYANQSQYANLAYSLGFFAAITVEAADVVIDLRGFEIRQSVAHSIAQRFHALIELGEAPFIGGQGPHNFGNNVTNVDGAIIMNGVLGRSAHHGIHGNTGARVYIKNVLFQHYEVAAISLNGFREVAIVNVHTLGTHTAIPVHGRWSNFRFLKDFATLALTLSAGANPSEESSLTNAMAILLTLEVEVFSDIVTDGLAVINATSHPVAAELFGIPDGLADCGATYGIVFHPVGHATNGFFNDPAREHLWETRDILIRDSEIGPTIARGQEVIALAHSSTGKVQKGPVGEVLYVERAMDSGGNYIVDPLVEAQLALADLVRKLTAPQQLMFNTLTVHPDLLSWRAGNISMATLVSSGAFRYVRNADNMHHVQKGVVSVRADGVQRIYLSNVKLHGSINMADRGKLDPLPGETSVFYFDGSDGGHAKQAPQRGFMGSDSRGISFAGSNQVYVKGALVENVYTKYGFAYGIDIFNHADTVNLNGVNIRNVSSLLFSPPGSETNIAMGPKVGRAWGIVTSDNTHAYCEQLITVEDVQTDYVSLAATHVHGCSV